jgi:hypothetical protein
MAAISSKPRATREKQGAPPVSTEIDGFDPGKICRSSRSSQRQIAGPDAPKDSRQRSVNGDLR